MNGLSTSVVRWAVSSQRPTQSVAGISGCTARRKVRWPSQEKSFRPSLEFDLKIDGPSICCFVGFLCSKNAFLGDMENLQKHAKQVCALLCASKNLQPELGSHSPRNCSGHVPLKQEKRGICSILDFSNCPQFIILQFFYSRLPLIFYYVPVLGRTLRLWTLRLYLNDVFVQRGALCVSSFLETIL